MKKVHIAQQITMKMMSCTNCSYNPENTDKNVEYTNPDCANSDNCASSCKNVKTFDWLSSIPLPASQEKFECVEVRFKNGRKCFYRNSQKIHLNMGDAVAVEVTQEIKSQENKAQTETRIVPGAYDMGVVNLTGELVKVQMNRKKIDYQDAKMPKIIRKATMQDIEQWNSFKDKEDVLRIKARELAEKHGLNMKFFDVEFQGDGTKGTFYYIAEERIDFRQIIVDMTSTFGIKVEMRQVGPRQKAARLGGIGSCGRELCCSSWMTDFPNVSPNAARYQQLAINVDSLTGACGKIKCCLNFELDSYLNALQGFPRQNTKIETLYGQASSRKIDVFKRIMWLSYDKQDSFVWYEVSVDQVQEMIAKNQQGVKVDLEEYSAQYLESKQSKEEDLLKSIEKEVLIPKKEEVTKETIQEKPKVDAITEEKNVKTNPNNRRQNFANKNNNSQNKENKNHKEVKNNNNKEAGQVKQENKSPKANENKVNKPNAENETGGQKKKFVPNRNRFKNNENKNGGNKKPNEK